MTAAEVIQAIALLQKEREFYISVLASMEQASGKDYENATTVLGDLSSKIVKLTNLLPA